VAVGTAACSFDATSNPLTHVLTDFTYGQARQLMASVACLRPPSPPACLVLPGAPICSDCFFCCCVCVMLCTCATGKTDSGISIFPPFLSCSQAIFTSRSLSPSLVVAPLRMSPLMMGRAAAVRAATKGKTDAAKAKLNGRYGPLVYCFFLGICISETRELFPC